MNERTFDFIKDKLEEEVDRMIKEFKCCDGLAYQQEGRIFTKIMREIIYTADICRQENWVEALDGVSFDMPRNVEIDWTAITNLLENVGRQEMYTQSTELNKKEKRFEVYLQENERPYIQFWVRGRYNETSSRSYSTAQNIEIMIFVDSERQEECLLRKVQMRFERQPERLLFEKAHDYNPFTREFYYCDREFKVIDFEKDGTIKEIGNSWNPRPYNGSVRIVRGPAEE